jgi:hypothetical protein
MSATQFGIGVAVVGAVIALLADAILPSAPPISVASIKYHDGMITVDRNIVSENQSVYMRRSTELIDANTGERVLFCAGVADINYPSGHVVRTVPLAQFIGNPECTPDVLPPGLYTPNAIYIMGERQVQVMGETFRIGEGQ